MESLSCKPYDIFCFLGWFFDELEAFFFYLLDQMLSALVTVIEIIPVPFFLTNAPSVGAGIAPSVLYFMTLFMIPTGLSMIVSSYSIRFLIRRIPFIG